MSTLFRPSYSGQLSLYGTSQKRAFARVAILIFAGLGFIPIRAEASMFEGEQLDTIANVMSWVVLVVAPVVAIGIFWMLHILPEKIAEKRHHPQTKAIQCLCLLSLAFGGLLWPLAWIWAYTKPVLHRIAYGSDVDQTHGHAETDAAAVKDIETLSDEAKMLRERVAELEARLNENGTNT